MFVIVMIHPRLGRRVLQGASSLKETEAIIAGLHSAYPIIIETTNGHLIGSY